MLVPHLHLNGHCEEAINLYSRAFNASVDSILYNSELAPDSKGIAHAEMHIHCQRVMLNDREADTGHSLDSTMQIVMVFDSVDELKNTYEIMKDGCIITEQMQETFYSACVVGFVDRFGVRWSFMV